MGPWQHQLEDVNGGDNDSTDDDMGYKLVPVTLSHGHCAKIGSKRYRVEWELH